MVCGHLHSPLVADVDGMLYANIGDWVEHCTALVEYEDGSLVLDHYYPGDREHLPVSMAAQSRLAAADATPTARAACVPVSGCRNDS